MDNSGLIPHDKTAFMDRSRRVRQAIAQEVCGPQGSYAPAFNDSYTDTISFPDVLSCMIWNAAVGEDVDFNIFAANDAAIIDQLRAVCAHCAKCDCHLAYDASRANTPSHRKKIVEHRAGSRPAGKSACGGCSIPKARAFGGHGYVSDICGTYPNQSIGGSPWRSEYDIWFGTYAERGAAYSMCGQFAVQYRYNPSTRIQGTVPASILSGLIMMVKINSPAQREAFKAALNAACAWFKIPVGGNSPAPAPAPAPDERSAKEAERAAMNARLSQPGSLPDQPPPPYSP